MLDCPFNIVDKNDGIERSINEISYRKQIKRLPIIHVSIADLHFGAMDPKYQYDILYNQFISVIDTIHFDLLTINGDIFHHKFMSNSDVVLYAMKFIDDICNVCRNKQNNPTIIILSGTKSHDAGQLKLFYHYITDKSIDIRIVEQVKFEYAQGAKILCIPELYDMGQDYYNFYLNQFYDLSIMHGVLDGAIYQAESQESGLHSSRAPSFKMSDFQHNQGYISAGHIHTPGCLKKHFYYNGSPLRWQFGEEQDKGFMIFLYDLDSGSYTMQFIPVQSKIYNTINIDNLLDQDPLKSTLYIDKYKKENNIDFLRLKVTDLSSEDRLSNIDIIKKYYRNNTLVKINIDRKISQQINLKEVEEENKELEEYSFLLDNSYTSHEKLVMYINHEKKYEYITLDEYKKLLNDI